MENSFKMLELVENSLLFEEFGISVYTGDSARKEIEGMLSNRKSELDKLRWLKLDQLSCQRKGTFDSLLPQLFTLLNSDEAFQWRESLVDSIK